MNVESPPRDQEKFGELGKELAEASKALGMNLHVEGFLLAWASGVRVLTERDSNGAIVSMLLMAAGERWVYSDVKATVLMVKGDVPKMMNFARTIAKAIGATGLLYEEDAPLEKTESRTRFAVVEEVLD